ncbi:CHASE domain-containing protein [Cellvibrio sp. OA-2007]|uniref:CHASE domain-containing protein n=1 Tax=Cellvibrio sp. OA-2007 TaxID=529823 RepID=UPI000785D281|nr:CHASE domain-containing protein [Cellvibrio sp. OA-2007]
MVKIWRMPATPWVLRIVLLALAYFLAGRLSLLLAIPPGFVSGLFLPMGISLGALLIWGYPMAIGVFVGSLLLNISVSPAPILELPVVLLAAEIACGSVLASAAGAWLIRRYIGFPNSLTDERSIFAFFILGGPIATSISATVGVMALFMSDVIPAKQVFYSWWTWWIGDAIGVLIAAPLVCVLFAEPRHFWRGRRVTVGVPIVVSSLIVVAVFVISSNNENRKLNDHFRQQAGLLVGSVDTGFSSVVNTLATLRSFFIASEEVTRDEFATYIEHVTIGRYGITGFSWNQFVKDAQRAQFEIQKSQSLGTDFFIKEKDSTGQFVPALRRDEYVVVSYIHPWQKNSVIIGFDVASDPIRREALYRARESGEFAMTRPVQLLQDKATSSGVLIYQPVYDSASLKLNPVAREPWLKGYVTAVVRIDDLLAAIVKPYASGDFQLTITDITDVSDPKPFYHTQEFKVPAYAHSLALSQTMALGGRQLLITVTPTEKYLVDHVSLQSWFVLAGGLLFCSLLGGFLLLITGRTQHITNLVEQRTKELAAILDNAVESILVVDEQGFIQNANPAAAQLFKYPIAQFAYLHIGELVPSMRQGLNFTGDDNTATVLSDGLGRCSNGNDLEIELSISPVALHERKFFTFIIHDASARRKMERLKNEFVATVSHELRTPLTSIKGALSIALSGKLGEAKLHELLTIASNNADRLARLVNDILDIEKLEFGKLTLTLEQCEVYPLLQQAIEQNQGYAARYGVQLQLDVPDEQSIHCLAAIDPHRFLQVMANLLSNAVKFSYLDGVVRVRLTNDAESLKVAVRDEGQGIADEFRSRIFQKFAQSDSSDTRNRDGTGLGLSISKIIVEQMGGSIDYSSTLGKGSTFYFTLPLTTNGGVG